MVVAEVDGGCIVANNNLYYRVAFADDCCIADAVCDSWTSFRSLMDNDQMILPNYDSWDESNLDVDVNNYYYIVVHNWDCCGNSMLVVIVVVIVVVDGDDDDKDNSAAAVVEVVADCLHGKMVADIGCMEEYDAG